MKFYTSDLHFDHENILRYENRPFDSVEDMNEALIANWNAKVKKGDEVYILGDFCFDKYGSRTNEILSRLNGQKFLIRGNHDYSFLRSPSFDKSAFVWVKDYAQIKDGEHTVILFHYPIAAWDKKHHNSIHLYGHIHSNSGTHHPLQFDLENAFNVGVDVCGYEPKTLQEIIKLGGGLVDEEQYYR